MSGETGLLAGTWIQQVGLFSRDLVRAKAFYGGTLGLQFMFEANDMLFFQLEGNRLMIGKAINPDHPTGGAVVYFNSQNFESDCSELEARGVKFAGPAVAVQDQGTHNLMLRTFTDPDGNALALMGLMKKG